MEHQKIRWWHKRELNAMVKSIRKEKTIMEVHIMRRALAKLKLRYWEVIRFWNPYWKGKWQTEDDGGYQWLDFVLHIKGHGAGVILFPAKYRRSGAHPFQIRAFENKIQFLKEHQIPYLVVERYWTSDEYAVKIISWMRNIKNEKV